MSRDLANRTVQSLAEDYDIGGCICVVVCENPAQPGRLEIDASFQAVSAVTQRGGEAIIEMLKRISDAIQLTALEFAAETKAEVVDRTDLSMPQPPGERPKA